MHPSRFDMVVKGCMRAAFLWVGVLWVVCGSLVWGYLILEGCLRGAFLWWGMLNFLKTGGSGFGPRLCTGIGGCTIEGVGGDGVLGHGGCGLAFCRFFF
jgi:hypothetical protein